MKSLKWAWGCFLIILAPFLLPIGALVPLPIGIAYIWSLSPGPRVSAGVVVPVLLVELLAYYAIGCLAAKRIGDKRRLSILVATAFAIALVIPIYTHGWMLFSLDHRLKTRWMTAAAIYRHWPAVNHTNPYADFH
jgi:hypothetical protein